MNPLQHFIKSLVWILLRLIYRVRVRNSCLIPSGPAILIPNHVSFIDAVLIAAHIQRPIRYAMHWKIYNRTRWIVSPMGAFPIASRDENETIYLQAFETIHETLAGGDLVCIFPEGMITRDGHMNPFRNGILKILERDPVPVIPVALKGLWGSYFSKKTPGMFKLPDHFMAKIEMIVGEPISPLATVEYMQECVQGLLEG